MDPIKEKSNNKEIQCLTGILNFLNRAIVPGRVFTRRMYAKPKTTSANGKKPKQHHHVNIDSEFKKDASVWQLFLENAGITTLCHPFVDRDMFITSSEISFYTDASGKILYGRFFDGRWIFGVWNKRFLEVAEPSI